MTGFMVDPPFSVLTFVDSLCHKYPVGRVFRILCQSIRVDMNIGRWKDYRLLLDVGIRKVVYNSFHRSQVHILLNI